MRLLIALALLLPALARGQMMGFGGSSAATGLPWSDDFERADGAVGNGWAALVSSAAGTIVSGVMRRSDTSGSYRVLGHSATGSLPADYEVSVTVPHATRDRDYWGIVGRWSAGTGVKLFWVTATTPTASTAEALGGTSFTITVTGGFPASWSVDQTHTVAMRFSGESVQILIDGSEYGTFTASTNATATGTSVGIAGDSYVGAQYIWINDITVSQ